MLYSLFEVISRQGFSAHAPRPARRAQWPALSLGLAACALAAPGLADDLEFDRDIQPLMAKYCFDCHNTDKAKGDINFERFMTKDAMVEELALWNAASTRITNMEMPPKRADQPSEEERATLVKWIEFLNASSEVDCTQIASEASVNWFPGFVMSRRLNRHEYENTIRDLLGVSVPLAQLFPADGAGGEGFDNHGDALFLSAIQGEKYLEAADLAVETAIPPRPQWPAFAVGLLSGTLDATADLAKTAAQRATASKLPLIAAVPGRGTLPREAASRVVRPFMERAWRRPVQPLEVESVLTMFDRGIARGEDYESAVKMAFKAALVSPNFLFLVEPEPLERGTYLLGDFPLASRLSYFLWSSMPDDQLLTLADHGALSDPEVLRGEVLRMLRDPKSAALGHLFASQWLGITPLGVTAKPDATRFPEFDEPLAASMRRETEYFFNDIVAEDRSLLNLIHSEYTFADERLARLYGLSEVTNLPAHDVARHGRGAGAAGAGYDDARAGVRRPRRRRCAWPASISPTVCGRMRGFPRANRHGYTMPYAWSRWRSLKKDFNVFSGLDKANSRQGDGHYAKTANFLTGEPVAKTTGKNISAGGISMDQLAAQQLGHLTPLPSMELGIDPVISGIDSNVGFTRLYGSYISWRSATQPVAKEINPRFAYERLFGSKDGGGHRPPMRISRAFSTWRSKMRSACAVNSAATIR
jgi:hypothetical protein